jgi:hypothetical protein
MTKAYKKTLTLLFVFLILPFALGLCCCTPDAFAKAFDLQIENHSAHHHSHDEGHHAKQESSGPKQHGHDECEHGELIGNFVKNEVVAVNFIVQHLLNNFAQGNIFLPSHDISKPAVSFSNTGPPGSFSSTPLYLQISNLRI